MILKGICPYGCGQEFSGTSERDYKQHPCGGCGQQIWSNCATQETWTEEQFRAEHEIDELRGRLRRRKAAEEQFTCPRCGALWKASDMHFLECPNLGGPLKNILGGLGLSKD